MELYTPNNIVGNQAMTLRLGDKVPDFTQNSSEGQINFYDWAGDSWVVFFSHPADFTPVCTTELGRVAGLKSEFDKAAFSPSIHCNFFEEL